MMLWDTQQIGLHSSARLARDRKTRRLKSNAFMALAATFDLAWQPPLRGERWPREAAKAGAEPIIMLSVQTNFMHAAG
jgi:hypothetical protein